MALEIAWYLLTNFKIISCMLAYKLTSIHARQQFIKTYLSSFRSQLAADGVDSTFWWEVIVEIASTQRFSQFANRENHAPWGNTHAHNPQLLRMRCHNHPHKSSFAMWAEQHHLAHNHSIFLLQLLHWLTYKYLYLLFSDTTTQPGNHNLRACIGGSSVATNYNNGSKTDLELSSQCTYLHEWGSPFHNRVPKILWKWGPRGP